MKGKIKYAKFDTSPRLQRLYAVLSDGREHSTLDIIHNASICAVNTAVAELRENGFVIRCRVIERGLHAYRMERGK